MALGTMLAMSNCSYKKPRVSIASAEPSLAPPAALAGAPGAWPSHPQSSRYGRLTAQTLAQSCKALNTDPAPPSTSAQAFFNDGSAGSSLGFLGFAGPELKFSALQDLVLHLRQGTVLRQQHFPGYSCKKGRLFKEHRRCTKT